MPLPSIVRWFALSVKRLLLTPPAHRPREIDLWANNRFQVVLFVINVYQPLRRVIRFISRGTVQEEPVKNFQLVPQCCRNSPNNVRDERNETGILPIVSTVVSSSQVRSMGNQPSSEPAIAEAEGFAEEGAVCLSAATTVLLTSSDITHRSGRESLTRTSRRR